MTEAEKAYASELKRNAGRTEPVDFSLFEKVQPLADMTIAGGSDDTGDVSQVVPLCKIETCANLIGAHTWHFASISGTTIGTKALVKGAEAIYWTVLELYTKPKELKAIREEFIAVQGEDYRKRYQMLSGKLSDVMEFFGGQAAK